MRAALAQQVIQDLGCSNEEPTVGGVALPHDLVEIDHRESAGIHQKALGRRVTGTGARAELDSKARALVVAQTSSAEMQAQIELGRAQVQQLARALQAANKQLFANYDAWRQADARANQLASQVRDAGGKTAVAALFAGLIGLGVGVAASSDS